MFTRIVLLSAMVCMAVTSHAQGLLQPCSSDEHYHQLLKEHPELAQYEQAFNDQLGAHFAGKITAVADTTTYDVPLVVHVVHDYGAENISDDVIYDAATYWAQVYVKQNADTSGVIAPFLPYIGNPRMRLHLATIDPNGNPTKGVKRYQSYLTNVGSDNAKYDAWPNNKYINIWFIGTFGAASAGAAAYAYYPSSGAAMPYYDGVISLASYVNTSKTIPHELGHVLNLQHVWGNTNAPDVACGNDGVDDTPPTKGHNPSGCTAAAIYDTACATGYMKAYTSGTGLVDSVVDYPDTTNAQNIMDYTYCSLMFTKGQAFRMRTALTSGTAGRNNLITAANLAATGALQPMPDLPPVAEFIMNRASGGSGVYTDTRTYFMALGNAASFNFRNASWNDTITSVNWSFSNDATTPSTSTIAVVPNKFRMPGWVTVTLTATSNAGSNTLVDPQAVYVADTVAAGGMEYAQHFGSAADVANWPMMNYYKNQFKWEFFDGAGMDDNSCIRYKSFDTSNRRTGSAVGDFDDVYTPAFNLAGVGDNVFFNFYTSGASTNSGLSSFTTRVNDSLEIDVSTTGGSRWTKIAGFSGTALANNGVAGTAFVPTAASAWVPRAVAVASAYRTANTFFRLRYRPGNTGNNLYVDNMYLWGFPAGVKEVLTAGNTAFSIFPNPSANGCNLVFKTGNDGLVSYTIKDITGKLVYHTQKTMAANSIQQEAVGRDVTPVAGMYFVTLTIDGVHMTQKMIVY